MQILFISGEVQIGNFLSGLQAEAIVAEQQVEIAGLAEDSNVTVICSGGSNQYSGTITKIDSGYQHMSPDGKWLGVRIMVRKNSSMLYHGYEPTVVND
jgi:hypothetical protein